MHEHGIADRLIEEALAVARDRGLSAVSRIAIAVGALSGVEPEMLRESLRHAAGQAGLQGVELAVSKTPPEAACRTCGRSISQAHACPACGGNDVGIITGEAVSIVSAE